MVHLRFSVLAPASFPPIPLALLCLLTLLPLLPLQRGAKLTAAAFHGGAGLLAVGFSGGVFELLQLPDLQPLHTLSIGQEKLTSLAFSPAGDWVGGVLCPCGWLRGGRLVHERPLGRTLCLRRCSLTAVFARQPA